MAGADSRSQIQAQLLSESSTTIQTIGARLQHFGLQANVFTEAHFLRAGYTHPAFANLLKQFIGTNDDDEDIERVLLLGFKYRHYDTLRGCRPAQFYAFLEFLRTREGRRELATLATQKIVDKRKRDDFSAIDVGWHAMFEAQWGDLTNSIRDCQCRHDKIIADLHRQVKMAEAAKADELLKINSNLKPVGQYVGLDRAIFDKACWQEYLDTCEMEGRPPVALNQEDVVEVVNTSAEAVRWEHVRTFLRKGQRRAQLEQYVIESIGRFERSKDLKAAKRLRKLLVAVGSKAATARSRPV